MGHDLVNIKDGEYTKTIYTLIKEKSFGDAIKILTHITETNPNRAGLSLLAYCHFHTQDFASAAGCYEQLIEMHPEAPEYKLHYAQALYEASLYEEAYKACGQLSDEPGFEERLVKLQAAIKYGEEDIVAAKSLVDACPTDDPDRDINFGCLLYKEKKYEEALQKFLKTSQVIGFNAHLHYNIALCYYRLKEFALALKYINNIVERGIRDHPELAVGMQGEGLDVKSVGNNLTLHETALTETFNLKAAIEYEGKNFEGAREALDDMPPRHEHELDAVTLHNHALINMDTKPTEGFEKLHFLLQQNPFPPETFSNLILLYCKFQYYDLAADVLAENADLTYGMPQHVYDFVDALITSQTSAEEAFVKFEEMSSRLADQLRRLTKAVQESRAQGDNEEVKRAVLEYEDALEKYIPVVMAQAKIYWDLENYPEVERIFRKSVEFCNESDVWRLNVAHVLFMQENKYKEAASFYEPIVKKQYDNILGVSAVVLANLCVSYIMTSQNEEAEDIMRKIEKEEEQQSFEDPNKKFYHLCIVNLVIGTLYCAKGNFEFGISRVIKSLEPFQKKLGTDTWFYTKICFLAFIENLAKHLISVKDLTIKECLQFLDGCESHGRHVVTVIDAPLQDEDATTKAKRTVAYEARLLKYMFLKWRSIDRSMNVLNFEDMK